MTSPLGILPLGAGASIGILTGGGLVVAAVLGAAGVGGAGRGRHPPSARDARIDPVHPGRAVAAVRHRRPAGPHPLPTQSVAALGPGRCGTASARSRRASTHGVEEVWRIARRGHDLVDARRRVDPDAIRREHRRHRGQRRPAVGTGVDDGADHRVPQAQLATVERLERVIGDADSRLRLLNARLDEAVARHDRAVGAGRRRRRARRPRRRRRPDGRRDGGAAPRHRGDRGGTAVAGTA